MLSRNRIKYIQSLSRKKDRDLQQCFIAETPKVVNEFLNSSYKVQNIFALQDWFREYVDRCPPGVEVTEIRQEDLEKISALKSPHGVLAVVKMQKQKPPAALGGRISIAVDDLQDPGNLGTIIRIADWFGVQDIFCSAHTVEAYNPKVVQASMGSLAHVAVHYLDLKDLLATVGVPVYAAMLEGDSLFDLENFSGGMLLVGNEGKGVREALLEYADKQISIPGSGRAESLNAAIATGIIISHFSKALG